VDDEGRLRMHDVLRDMGRDIVKRDAKRSEKWAHLWDTGTATDVLKRREASVAVLFRASIILCV
jgi:hypothetical protein